MRITPIGDLDAFFKDMAQSRESADSHVQPWQAELKAGDHFVRLVDENGVLAIYGEFVTADTADTDGDEDMDFYSQPHMKNFRFSRCFSILCPEGELGDTHVATIGKKLSPTQFNLAREMGWPSDSRLRKLVELD